MRMNSQTRIIVATAFALAAVDIAVRVATAPKNHSSNVVTAREFRLADDRGNVRMTIKTDANGEPGMRMYDQTGTTRLQIDTWENTPSMILFDRDGQRRVYYGMENADGSGMLSMMGPDGRDVLRVESVGDRPEVTLFDRDTFNRVHLSPATPTPHVQFSVR